jgi:hypothetical protein
MITATSRAPRDDRPTSVGLASMAVTAKDVTAAPRSLRPPEIGLDVSLLRCENDRLYGPMLRGRRRRRQRLRREGPNSIAQAGGAFTKYSVRR